MLCLPGTDVPRQKLLTVTVLHMFVKYRLCQLVNLVIVYTDCVAL